MERSPNPKPAKMELQSHMKNIRFNRNGRSRLGATTTSYVCVLVICSIVALSGVFVLTDSFVVLDKIPGKLADNSGPVKSDVAEISLAENSAEDPVQNADLLGQLVYVLVSTASVIGVSILYLRKSRQKATVEKCLTHQVEHLEDKTVALQTLFGKQERIGGYFHNEYLTAGKGTIGDIMTTGVETISPDTGIKDAEDYLNTKGFRRMIVADEHENLVGVLSKKDVRSRIGDTVAEVMTTNMKTANRHMLVGTALSVLLKNRISCLPVVEGNKFVGLLTTSDLLIYLQCVLQQTYKNSESLQSDLDECESGCGVAEQQSESV